MSVYDHLVQEHDLSLIALAGLICLLGAYTAFALLQRARASSGRIRLASVASAAVAGGSALWASHFIALLAGRTGLPTGLGTGFTALSIALAIALTGIGLAVAIGARGPIGQGLGGAVVGLAVAATHYLNLAGLQAHGAISYHLGPVALSLIIALVFGAGSVRVALASATPIGRGLAALLLTVAMAGLHVTAMAALELPRGALLPLAGPAVIPVALLAVAIAGFTILLFAASLVGAIVDQHLAKLGLAEAHRLRDLANAAFEGIAIHADGRLLDGNRALAQLTGRRRSEMIGREVLSFIPDEERPRVGPWISEGAEGAYETKLLRADGGRVPVEIHVRRMDYAGRDVCVAAIRDITERKEAEARIHFISKHDGLTELPNRALFRDRLEQALAAASKPDGRERREPQGENEVAVLCLDLDDFKEVNEARGHAEGDALLKQVAARLVRAARESDVVARLGGDEFAIVHAGLHQPRAAAAFAERVMAALAQPFEAEGEQLAIGASIGIALFPADGADAGTLLRNADTAQHRAKADGGRTYRFFEPAMNARLQAHRALEYELKQALPQQQLELHYQPQVEIRVNRITGFEALLRWRHPKHGLIMPADFLPLAEDSGLIVALGEWVLRTACAAAVSWAEHIKIAVNLSPAQFVRSDLTALVRAVLEDQRLAPDRLELEINESVLLRNADHTLKELRRLKALGVRIAMADFGTGFSSLSFLHRFPFDKIKIHQSFIRALGTDADSSAIVRAVIGLGRSLEIPVIAEGVETAMQLDLLRRENCDEVQGYLINRPMPLESLEYLLAAAGMLVLPTVAAAAPAKRKSAVVSRTPDMPPVGVREPATVGR